MLRENARLIFPHKCKHVEGNRNRELWSETKGQRTSEAWGNGTSFDERQITLLTHIGNIRTNLWISARCCYPFMQAGAVANINYLLH